VSAAGRGLSAIEPMRLEDLEDVLAIERLAHPFPWTAANFADSLASGCGAWVLRIEAAIAGYAVMMFAPGEVHLLNLTVTPARQRCGMGRMLIEYLLAVARGRAAPRMLLEVRPSNVPALSLYHDWGFERIGVRRGYYPAGAGREDAIVMERRL